MRHIKINEQSMNQCFYIIIFIFYTILVKNRMYKLIHISEKTVDWQRDYGYND